MNRWLAPDFPLYCRAGNRQLYRYRFVQPLPEVDWRQQGIVGPVKNQHVNGSKCGCCWAFATVGVVECINAMATGEVASLSEQQLLDCDHAGGWVALMRSLHLCIRLAHVALCHASRLLRFTLAACM